tara:strand:- start:281 stop:508 length:228 start_codon:yes stop_codon:yes gene_type:complete
MRVAKLIDIEPNAKIIEEHGLYAEVLGLSETPTGLKARLKFGDDHREQLPVQNVRILQEKDWEKLIKDPYKRHML